MPQKCKRTDEQVERNGPTAGKETQFSNHRRNWLLILKILYQRI